MSDTPVPTLSRWHLARGAAEAPPAGPPESYRDPTAEAAACLSECGLVDLLDRDLIEVTGRDRVRLLHAMLSNDVKSLAGGQGCWATFCNEQGRIVSEMRLLVLDDRIWLDMEGGSGDAFVAAIDRFIIADKCYFSSLGGRVAAVGLIGPGAARIAAAAGLAKADGIPPYGHHAATLAGAQVRIARVLRASEHDLTVFAPPEALEAVGDALVAAGARPVGRAAFEASRVRGGVPRFGADITGDTIPIEAGLRDRAIAWTKGCYRGQEVICRLDTLGEPARRLVRLEGVPGAPPPPGAELLVEGKKAGAVTSVARGPAGEVHALGYLKRRLNEPGTAVTWEAGGAAGSLRVRDAVRL